jgi:exonuclease 1
MYRNRKNTLKEAEKYYLTGDLKRAMQKYSLAVDITPKMARAWISSLKKMNIEYYVAPYEADAQLAYLYHKGKFFQLTNRESLSCVH